MHPSRVFRRAGQGAAAITSACGGCSGGRTAEFFDDDERRRSSRRFASGAKQTTDGSLSDLPFKPLPARCGTRWPATRQLHGPPAARRYNKCFYYKDRRRVRNAHMLVVNHALFFSDLALRRHGVSILPDYDVVILDEAHTVEAVAGDHLGIYDHQRPSRVSS